MTILGQLQPNASADWPRRLVMCLPLVAAAVLAIVGAFGSYIVMGLPLRLLHFLATSAVIGALAVGLSVLLRRYVFKGVLPSWAWFAVAVVLAPAGGLMVQQSLAILAPRTLNHVSFLELTGQVLLVNLAIAALRWLLLRNDRSVESLARETAKETASQQPDDTAKGSREFRAKLPVAQRQAAIMALSAEDHYVRVHTDRGNALILMNLSCAVEALGPETGVRIHRSHWVANAVALETARIGRAGVRLDDATQFPISRAGRKLLKDFYARSA
jgi:DNA-binding LytR/AlgR family response regulator